MREIKFRAWVKKDYDGHGIADYMEDDASCFNDPFEEHKHGNIVLMQYTGLKDKNGVEIYEGDIVELIEPSHTTELFHSYPAVIRFREYGFHLVQTDGEMDFLSNQRNNIRIIGNIYEHPHLLEVGE